MSQNPADDPLPPKPPEFIQKFKWWWLFGWKHRKWTIPGTLILLAVVAVTQGYCPIPLNGDCVVRPIGQLGFSGGLGNVPECLHERARRGIPGNPGIGQRLPERLPLLRRQTIRLLRFHAFLGGLCRIPRSEDTITRNQAVNQAGQ